MPTIGEKAPDFSLPDHSGKTISLKDFKGKKMVLYFYPKDNTSGCMAEACSFRDNLSSIRRKGTEVLGISADSIESHEKFRTKHQLQFSLLSDEEKKVISAYGVWKQKSMYGKKYWGIERTTFIINEKGIITHIYQKVKVNGHVEEVLEALKKM